jgi:hypothetical protein
MAYTKLPRAYLYGVDFTEAQVQSADFGDAVLTGVNFKGASISTAPQAGSASTFNRAFLQGASLTGSHIKDMPNFSNAFVDFSPHGNNIYIWLAGSSHNQFACPGCSPTTGTDVCVLVNYPGPTLVPPASIKLTCPNGHPGSCGDATPNGSNEKWRSTIPDLGTPPPGVPPAWYKSNSTYIQAPADPKVICNGNGSGSATIFW